MGFKCVLQSDMKGPLNMANFIILSQRARNISVDLDRETKLFLDHSHRKIFSPHQSRGTIGRGLRIQYFNLGYQHFLSPQFHGKKEGIIV